LICPPAVSQAFLEVSDLQPQILAEDLQYEFNEADCKTPPIKVPHSPLTFNTFTI
jgi:hypothetical protein